MSEQQQKVEQSYDPYGDLAKTYTDTAQAEAGQDTGDNKQDTVSNKQNLVYSSSKKDAWANSPYSEGKKDVTKNGGYGSRQRRHSTPSDSSGNSLNAVKLYMLSTVPKGPTWTMAARTHKVAKRAVCHPDPGAYNPNASCCRRADGKFKTLPSWPFVEGRRGSGGPPGLSANRKAPDCTTYDPINPNHKTPSFSILGRPKTRPKSAGVGMDNPGPGTYNPGRISKPRGTTFTGRSGAPKSRKKPVQQPGPGEYAIDACYDVAMRKSPVARWHRPTKTTRPKSAQPAFSCPGPGTYSLPTTLRQRDISFGSRRATMENHGKLVVELGEVFTSF